MGRLILGLLSLLLGAILVPLPVPLGWFFLLVGMALVTNEVLWFGRLITWFRSKLPWADRILMGFYAISPPMVREFLDATAPLPIAAAGAQRADPAVESDPQRSR